MAGLGTALQAEWRARCQATALGVAHLWWLTGPTTLLRIHRDLNTISACGIE